MTPNTDLPPSTPAEAQQGPSAGCAPTAGSLALLDPKDAPKDGTLILAAVGWPWLVPAMWCEYAEDWVIASPQVDYLHGSSVRHFENDTEPKIAGWLPIPPLPGGYVFRSENAKGMVAGVDGSLPIAKEKP